MAQNSTAIDRLADFVLAAQIPADARVAAGTAWLDTIGVMLAGTLEYEHDIVEDLLSVVVFTDQGTLGTSIWDDDAFRWRIGVGAGVRIQIPFLGNTPLGVDFAFPLLDEDEDD